MDNDAPVAPHPSEGESPSDWVSEFQAHRQKILEAASEWAVRWDEPEGRFISALVGAIEMVGKLSSSAQDAFVQTTKAGRAAAEAELAKAKELHRAAQLALTQVRNIELAAKADHEALGVKMIDRTLPLFIERLEKVLVIHERRWNKDVERRRYAAAGAVALAIFLGGFFLAKSEDYGRLARMDYCQVHLLQAGGHFYCRMDQ